MKRIRKNKKDKSKMIGVDKYRSLFFALGCVLFIGLGFLSYQGYVFYSLKIENKHLTALKDEYEILVDEIEDIKQLKVQYEVVLNKSNDLSGNKESLDKKVNELNSDIKDLEKKITDVNNKIKNLS